MKRIACISQKGGVGKSTLARDIAVQFAANGWDARIVDMDDRQTTTILWQARRQEGMISPPVHVFGCKSAESAIAFNGCDLVIFDGTPYSNQETAKIAAASDLVVIPTGPSLDDLHPQVLLAHELQKVRVGAKRILFVLNSIVGDIDGNEVTAARDFINQAGYRVAKFALARRPSYQHAMNVGRSISEVSAPTLRVQAIGVVEEIGAILNEHEEKAA